MLGRRRALMLDGASLMPPHHGPAERIQPTSAHSPEQ